MRNFRLLAASAILTLGLVSPVRAELFKEAFPDIVTQLSDEYQTDVGQLDLRHGNIVLEGGFAQVAVPEGYYFLGPKDGRYVIEKLWENPEDRTLLGVIFPAELTPFDSASWAITFQFEEIGYVSDADAESYDYAELLKTMQSDTVEGNETRAQGGFPAIELLGWAAEPHYDKVERKLHWAKRLSFAGTEGETLNYNIRALGRKGVLIVNFIAAMDQLGEVQLAVP